MNNRWLRWILAGIENADRGVLTLADVRPGAVAIRTYASWWVNAGGKYSCADLDDTTASQVYKDTTYANTDAAVDATGGGCSTGGGTPSSWCAIIVAGALLSRRRRSRR